MALFDRRAVEGRDPVRLARRRARATRARSTPARATTSARRSCGCWPSATTRTLKRAATTRSSPRRAHRPTQRVVLAFPLTYMNESGQAVSALVRRYSIDDPAQDRHRAGRARPRRRHACGSRSAAGWPATTGCAASRQHLEHAGLRARAHRRRQAAVEGARRRPRAVEAVPPGRARAARRRSSRGRRRRRADRRRGRRRRDARVQRPHCPIRALDGRRASRAGTLDGPCIWRRSRRCFATNRR